MKLTDKQVEQLYNKCAEQMNSYEQKGFECMGKNDVSGSTLNSVISSVYYRIMNTIDKMSDENE